MKSKYTAYPYIVWMALFIVVPLCFMLYFSFTDQSGMLSFSSFSEIGRFAKVFEKSLWLAFESTVICLLIAYPLALLLSNMSAKSQRTMVMLVMLPMWMNFLLRIYAWMTLLEHNGLINKFLELFGVGPLKLLHTDGAVLIGMVYNFLPFMILPVYSVIVKIDKSLIEAAQDLGCSPFGVLRRVLLPLSMPGVITGITMVFVPAASTFVISQRLGGGDLLIGDLIEMYFIGAEPNFNIGSALSLVLMVIILICMALMNKADAEDMEGLAV